VAAQQEYDTQVYPGFLRQSISKWLDDGTSAPSGRARGKADLFQLSLSKPEIDADIAEMVEKSGHTEKPGAKRRAAARASK
jgi:hypothetical protein